MRLILPNIPRLLKNIGMKTRLYLVLAVLTLSYLTSHIIRMAGFIDTVHADYYQVSALLLGVLISFDSPPEF